MLTRVQQNRVWQCTRIPSTCTKINYSPFPPFSLSPPPDLYRQFGDAPHEQESSHNHYNFSQTLLADHLNATQLPEHQLITWTDGPFPPIVTEKL